MLLFLAQGVAYTHSGNSSGVMVVFIVIAIGLVMLLTRLAAGSMDGDRVERYISERGGKLIERDWEPFGPGWVGEKNSRIYSIVYSDSRGLIHKAHVKTSMWSGVYLTNDVVIGPPEALRGGRARPARQPHQQHASNRHGNPGAEYAGGRAQEFGRVTAPAPVVARGVVTAEDTVTSVNAAASVNATATGTNAVVEEIVVKVADYEALLNENERLQQQIRLLQAQQEQRNDAAAAQPPSDASGSGYRS